MKNKDGTENCYLTYSDEEEGGGYLICSYNHKIGEECLMDENDREVVKEQSNPSHSIGMKTKLQYDKV